MDKKEALRLGKEAVEAGQLFIIAIDTFKEYTKDALPELAHLRKFDPRFADLDKKINKVTKKLGL